MLLDKSTTKLQVVLAAAKTTNDCDFSGYASDIKRDAIVPGVLYHGNTNGVTVVDAISAPADNTAREIVEFIVYNKDTANVTVIVQYNVNGIVFIVKKSTLTAGQSLTYQKKFGWQVN